MRRLAQLLCAAALLAAVTACSDDTVSSTAAPASTSTAAPAPTTTAVREVADEADHSDFEDLAPGTHSVDPDNNPATPLNVSFDIPTDGWSEWIGAAKFTATGHVAMSVTTVDNLVGDACTDHDPTNPPVGPTVDDLATALSQLAPFQVTSPPADTTLLGYPAKHLELTVPDLPVTVDDEGRHFPQCGEGELKSWISPGLGGPFWGYNSEPGRTEQFWILDVNGTRLILETNQAPTSPPDDIAQLQAIFNSLQIHP